MIYAPIIIPTCNRIKHLKLCIESLKNNKWASYTDVYISVDFPPNEKYIDGYNAVLEWLNQEITGFKSFNVFYQKENLGPSANVEFLMKKISKYDRWIITEDDNEFSTNFIEYMDYMLDKYEKDESVFGVCGALESVDLSDKRFSAYKTPFNQPYGCGFWRNKYDLFLVEKENIILNRDNMRFYNVIKMYSLKPWCFRIFVNGILYRNRSNFWNGEKLTTIDAVIQLYLVIKNMNCIFPTKCKARTWGNDGSGYTMPKNDSINPEKIWPLDQDDDFEFVMATKKEEEDLIRANKTLFVKTHLWEMMKTWLKYVYIMKKNNTRI